MTGPLPASHAAIAALIPHQGGMCLWQQVLEVDERSVRCATRSHQDAQHPLRHDGRLAAVHLVEYAAQLMAIHGALAGDGARRPGVLAGLRDVQLHGDEPLERIDGPLTGHATRLVQNADGAMYQCVVAGGGRELLSARISVIHPA